MFVMFQLTNKRRRSLSKKKKHDASANLTQDMLNELNKHTLPGYELYSHFPDDYDVDAAWNSDRYYNGPSGQRYKVSMPFLNTWCAVIYKNSQMAMKKYTNAIFFLPESCAILTLCNGDGEVRPSA